MFFACVLLLICYYIFVHLGRELYTRYAHLSSFYNYHTGFRIFSVLLTFTSSSLNLFQVAIHQLPKKYLTSFRTFFLFFFLRHLHLGPLALDFSLTSKNYFMLTSSWPAMKLYIWLSCFPLSFFLPKWAVRASLLSLLLIALNYVTILAAFLWTL